jgi:hypothetical protein
MLTGEVSQYVANWGTTLAAAAAAVAAWFAGTASRAARDQANAARVAIDAQRDQAKAQDSRSQQAIEEQKKAAEDQVRMAREAIRIQHDQAERQTKLQMFNWLLQRLEEKEHRDARHAAREIAEKIKDKQLRAADLVTDKRYEEDRLSVDMVCRDFDVAGLLDRQGIVDQECLDRFYSIPFQILYKDLLGEYVAAVRNEGKRGSRHFWEVDEYYERVKGLKHPVETDGKWQPRP